MSSVGAARSVIVAGIGGLLLGHIAWLVLISLATSSSSVNAWVLLISVLVIIGAVLVGRRAWRRYEKQDYVWAAFLGALPVSPVLFTLIVLGQTYL
ncbi:MAG: hypothetical protein KIH64_007010 [Mycobacterium sp.]|nr:hypothetical protein [Mycobacterium sp.]